MDIIETCLTNQPHPFRLITSPRSRTSSRGAFGSTTTSLWSRGWDSNGLGGSGGPPCDGGGSELRVGRLGNFPMGLVPKFQILPGDFPRFCRDFVQVVQFIFPQNGGFDGDLIMLKGEAKTSNKLFLTMVPLLSQMRHGTIVYLPTWKP